MEEWKTYILSDVCRFINGRAYSQDELLPQGKYQVLRVGNVGNDGHEWYYSDMELPNDKYCNYGDLLYTWACNFGPVIWTGKKAIYHYHIWKVEENPEIIDRHFLFYLLLCSTESFKQSTNGSVMIHITKKDMERQEVRVPSLEIQKQIASILDSLYNKIELNNRINHNLIKLAQELFNNKIAENACRSSGWRSASLLDIAEYLNGLAMQKYPAINGEFSLPVLKIKELGQQACDANSDRCTETIPEQYIVKDGDIIFSWSGTLLLDFWCGGKCGLNQHLFKVSSDMYPDWFVYFWTKHHLDRFIRIAKDKAVTMGHIKRGDLGKAEVVIPEDAVMKKLDGEIAPLISECIERRIENRKLQGLRNSLLPKLMSGELKINDLTC